MNDIGKGSMDTSIKRAVNDAGPTTTLSSGWWSRLDPSILPAVLFIVLLCLIGARNSNFFGTFNIGNVLTQIVPLLLVAAGQTFVVATGGIDLSVGSIVSLASVVSVSLFAPWGIPATIAMTIAVSVLCGVVNGLLVSRGLEPFLVTLATLSVIQGAAFLIRESPGGGVPESWGEVAGYFKGGIVPFALPIAVVAIIVATVVLRRTQVGFDILATGSNADVAELCGIRTTRAHLWAYGLSGLLGGLAGLYVNARTLGGDPLAGATFTLDSIAAVVLGGTLITGGRASIIGSAAGALSLGLLSNVLNFANVSSFYQQAVKGAVVVLAVAVPLIAVRVSRRVRATNQARAVARNRSRVAVAGGPGNGSTA